MNELRNIIAEALNASKLPTEAKSYILTDIARELDMSMQIAVLKAQIKETEEAKEGDEE